MRRELNVGSKQFVVYLQHTSAHIIQDPIIFTKPSIFFVVGRLHVISVQRIIIPLRDRDTIWAEF